MALPSIDNLIRQKQSNEPIVGITAYDFYTAKTVDSLDFDFILVGDSLAMVVLGYETTLPVTVDEMIHHGKAVVRGAKNSLIVVDMPFMSYQQSPDFALGHAGRILKETGAQAVKLEGGQAMVPTVKKLTSMGIPVMGHVGLMPQSVNQHGGYKVQGRTDHQSQQLKEDVLALQEAGCFAIVLECIPADLALHLSECVEIPLIGIGAGPDCDGQILVVHDILGLCDTLSPKFMKRYAELGLGMKQALQDYREDVKAKRFPSSLESFI